MYGNFFFLGSVIQLFMARHYNKVGVVLSDYVVRWNILRWQPWQEKRNGDNKAVLQTSQDKITDRFIQPRCKSDVIRGAIQKLVTAAFCLCHCKYYYHSEYLYNIYKVSNQQHNYTLFQLEHIFFSPEKLFLAIFTDRHEHGIILHIEIFTWTQIVIKKYKSSVI